MKVLLLMLIFSAVFYCLFELMECNDGMQNLKKQEETRERGPKRLKRLENSDEFVVHRNVSDKADRLLTSAKDVELLKPSVIMVEKLSKYERDHFPVTVMFEKSMTPVDWFHNYDKVFRNEVAERMNKCESLKMSNKQFLPDDIVHVSISPYVQEGHLSVSVVVLDPLSPGKYVFILGSNFFKCFNEELTQYEEMMNSTTKAIYIGLPETGYLAPVQNPFFIPFLAGLAVGGFLGLILFVIGYALKRKGTCGRFHNASIQEAEQPPTPALSLSHLSEEDKYAVLRRIYGLNKMFKITQSQEDLLSLFSKPCKKCKETTAPSGEISETSL